MTIRDFLIIRLEAKESEAWDFIPVTLNKILKTIWWAILDLNQ